MTTTKYFRNALMKKFGQYLQILQTNVGLVGDSVIFYQAGKNGKKFTGSASIASRLTKHVDDHLNLTNIETWNNHVLIEDVKDHLDFIKNKKTGECIFKEE